MRRSIAVVTGSRADYGLLYWVLRELQNRSDLELQLLVTGSHLSQRFGHTVEAIRADGFAPAAEVASFVEVESPDAVAQSIARGIAGFGQAFVRLRPQILLLMADRYEIFAAAAAAVSLGIPIAHLSGGEATEGLFDDQFRHAIAKMSHLHFPSMERYRQRLIWMGEPPERVFTVGEPGLDHVRRTPLLSLAETSSEIGLDLSRPTALVTFHPVTLELDKTGSYVEALLLALDELHQLQLVITYPGADPSAEVIMAAFEAYARRRQAAVLFKSLGTRRYLSLLRHASVMIGNSSSGLIEAPCFELPVVNLGSRQRGRVRAENVIDVEPETAAIVAAVRRALQPGFRERLRGLVNPYGDGRASERIVELLGGVELASLRYKPFHDAGERS